MWLAGKNSGDRVQGQVIGTYMGLSWDYHGTNMGRNSVIRSALINLYDLSLSPAKVTV